MRIIEDYRDIDEKLWEEFVLQHPSGNVFHTPQMYKAYEESPRFAPLILALEVKGKLKGIFIAVIENVLNGIFSRISSRAIVRGGPLVQGNHEKLYEILLFRYNQIIRKKAILTQFRNFEDRITTEFAFQKAGYHFIDHLNILVNLDLSEEELWQKLSSKSKNKIRKARKEDVFVTVDSSKEGLEYSYRILREVYARAKLPLPELEFFRNIRKHLKGNPQFQLFVARFKNEIIACRIALVYKRRIYDFFAGSVAKYNSKCPNDLLPWEIFKWGIKNGYKVFDFGGAGSPNVPYGVRDYKMKFGGDLIRPGRYEKVHNPVLFSIARKAFSVWQKLA